MYVYDGKTLSKEQSEAYDLIENSTDNFFITGKAGTGKSLLLQFFVANTKKRFAVVAPTGVAALNVGGQTIHSFFALGVQVQNPLDHDMLTRGLNDKRLDILKNLDALVIDEVSMVRVDVMDMIDAKLRAARNSVEPFGGCQIICFGDLYQLPPVVGRDEEVEHYLMDTYHTIFFFGAPGVRLKEFKIISFDEIHRQSDTDFKKMLNAIRVGDIDGVDFHSLNRRVLKPEKSSSYLTLTPTRSAADKVNERRMQELETPWMTYHAIVEGEFSKEEIPTPEPLRLKVGTQVMMLKNHMPNWVNGTIGKIVSLSQDCIRVSINGVPYSVDMETWTKYEYKYNTDTGRIEHQPVGYFKQFPVVPAYAITIHKAQGRTYDSVLIDYLEKGAFAAGQTYVALSRCSRFDGLYLARAITPEDIKVNQEIISYLNGNLHIPAVSRSYVVPQIKEDKKPKIRWTLDGRVQISGCNSPKKITGTRLSSILGEDKYSTPFKTWCAIARVYEEPFKDNKFTIAGKTIEPKQFEYVKKRMSRPGRSFVRPADKFGEEPDKKMGYDFFHLQTVFGGMWDYLMTEDGRVKAVFEMKTTSNKNRFAWESSYPKDKIIQAALYAWLLGVEEIYMVSSYIYPWEYDNPEMYVCSEANTTIRRINISQYFPAFEEEIVEKAIAWWGDHVETNLSPVYDLVKDKPILDALQALYPDADYETTEYDEDDYEDIMEEFRHTKVSDILRDAAFDD